MRIRTLLFFAFVATPLFASDVSSTIKAFALAQGTGIARTPQAVEYTARIDTAHRQSPALVTYCEPYLGSPYVRITSADLLGTHAVVHSFVDADNDGNLDWTYAAIGPSLTNAFRALEQAKRLTPTLSDKAIFEAYLRRIVAVDQHEK